VAQGGREDCKLGQNVLDDALEAVVLDDLGPRVSVVEGG
jgi:hypothetical protein